MPRSAKRGPRTAVSERSLSLRELNRSLLARQLLLGRARVPLATAVERIGGLQAQWPPSPYVALSSRVEGFDRARLASALRQRRLVKATLMRWTLHIVSARDYRLFAAALKEGRLEALERRLPPELRVLDLPALAERAAAYAAETPRTRMELFAHIADTAPPSVAGEQPWSFWNVLQSHGEIVHAPASGYWRLGGSARFIAARSWLGGERADAAEGLRHLVRRYLAAFGPASQADLASWSGLTAGALRPALAALEPELRRFRSDDGTLLVDVTRRPLPPADTPAPVRFLAKWDSSLIAHAATARERILPRRFHKTVIRVNGDVLPSLLVDGFVSGLWRVERAGAKAMLLVQTFEPLPRETRREIADEGERLVRFVEPDAASFATRFASRASRRHAR